MGENQALLKLVIQGVISLLALGGGLCLMFTLPELRSWGTGIIGLVLGYWLS